MPRKDKEAYNNYMRNYMKKKYRNETGKTPMEDDFDATTAPVLDLQGDTTQQLMKVGKEIFKDPETGKPDKVMQYIEKGAKYLPLIMKFAEGFMTNMKDFNARPPATADPQRPKIQAPDGWEHFSPLEKMKYKYSRPAWYEAGLAWDQYKETGMINSAVNTGYVDPSYSHQPRRGQITHAEDQVTNLADLSRKHPEPPLIKDQGSGNPAVVEGDEKSFHDPKLEAVIKEKQNRNKPKEDKPMEQEKEPTQQEELVEALRQDNARYIQMAVSFIGNMTMKDFQNKINDLDQVVKGVEPLLDLLPVHLREMIKQSSDQEVLDIFKNDCADKYKWCEENKHLPKITAMFNNLKSKL